MMTNLKKIWFALMKTRIFCSSCCQKYADIICYADIMSSNSKIEIK